MSSPADACLKIRAARRCWLIESSAEGMTIALGAAGLVIGVVALLTWRSRRARQLHPQDVAFAVCTAFGADLGLPREVRIRRIFPAIGDDTISAWLQDFERVDVELENVARAGGPQR